MDDLAAHSHERVPSLNHRKRKADSDECIDQDPVGSTDAIFVDSPSGAAGLSNAPRQSCLADSEVWPSPHVSSSPLSSFAYKPHQVKRLRLEQSDFPSPRHGASRRSPRKSPTARTTAPRPPPVSRQGSDVEDVGIISFADPGPSSGSLRRLREAPVPPISTPKITFSANSCIPIDSNSPHIPSVQPLINRQTLQELDLDAILRNPQLRHDILFDTGLQFRPTSSRRKREMSDSYWTAVAQELESGCTCVSFDLLGKPHSVVCVCDVIPSPAVNSVVAFSPLARVLTLRMPTRIRPLLTEFLEVLLSVIQPLSNASGVYVNPTSFDSQMKEHAAQAAYMRSIFDPDLIQQELSHEMFDPSGLFRSIGATLKGHCAPMRDPSIDAMVDVAQTCSPGRGGSKVDAVKAVRMCMDILELMKLDIANHQLQTLRPFLIRTSGQFELTTFRGRPDVSLHLTREWLRLAHQDLLSCEHLIPHPSSPSSSFTYRMLSHNQQAYVSVLRGLTNLVFRPLSPIHIFSPTTPPRSILSKYPETLYLDSSRLLLFSTDAADATAMSLCLLLYRQLLVSDPGFQHGMRVTNSDLLKLKQEIRDIGSSHLACCLQSGTGNVENHSSLCQETTRWQDVKHDVALQIAMRATESQRRADSSELFPSPVPSTRCVPSERMLNLAQRWIDSNMQSGSALTELLYKRLSDAVFNVVLHSTFPGTDLTTSCKAAVDFSLISTSSPNIDIPLATGMEPLADEIRSLGDRISKLALIHLNAYLPLYEQDGFFES